MRHFYLIKKIMTLRFKTKVILLLFLSQILFLNCYPQTGMYTNPIINKGLADPFIIYDTGYYYLFATGKANDERFIPIYKSKDLTQWEFVRGAVSQGSGTDWNFRNFWAPEVIKLNKNFYLYYTASPDTSYMNTGNRVGVAISDNIDGPYTSVGIVIPHASIDGMLLSQPDTRE
jgi:beta-xylosidase